jgi:hypothetical protein
MIYEINKTKDSELEKIYKEGMNELNDFFELGWNRNLSKIFLVSDRNSIDALLGRKTEDFVVGWADKNNDIYLLCKENYEKESSHTYSDEEYFALLKHELTHCFAKVVSGFSKNPIWLFEGVSIFLSGQNELKIKPEKYNFFLDSYNDHKKDIYKEAGFAVEFLVKEYGKEKLIKLIKKAKEIDSKNDFAKLFETIYNFSLSYDNFKIL